MRTLFKNILQIARRALGTSYIIKEERHQRSQEHKLLISLGNAVQCSTTNPTTLRASTTFKRCAEIVSLLSPLDVKDKSYVRVGKDYDGGYVMLDDFGSGKIEAAYSFGIGADASWDEDMANRGFEVFMYDHTIDRLPAQHSRFHFKKIGVTGHKKEGDLRALPELISENGHAACSNLIMKMDVEGHEWEVFAETPSGVLNQFCQFVVEFHNLTNAAYDPNCRFMIEVLNKINATHQCVHLHANGGGVPLWIGGLVIPALLEVTYIRRRDVEGALIPNERQFPTAIDHPTFKGWPDIYLGRFTSSVET